MKIGRWVARMPAEPAAGRGRASLVLGSPYRSLARTSPRTRDCRPRPPGSTQSRVSNRSMSPAAGPAAGTPAEGMYQRLAWIDLHQDSVAGLRRPPGSPDALRHEVGAIRTVIRDPAALFD